MFNEATQTGKELEQRVAEAYRQMGAKVQHDVDLAGNRVDVYVEIETPDRGLHRVVVEAEDRASAVGTDVVNSFASRVSLLRSKGLVDEGVIVSAPGVSREARDAAETHGLRLLELADLEAMVAQTEETRRPTPAYTPPTPPDPATLPDPGPLPPGSRMVFARNELFTGRAESLKALGRILLHEEARSTLVTQAVQGMGGVGKTQLAVEFAYRYGRFFHGVHWVNGAQPDAVGVEIAACGEAMGLPGWPEKQPEQIARTLEEWRRGGPRLAVLDNLEDVSAAWEWLGRLSGSRVRVLVTARRSDWPGGLGLEPLQLEVFTPAESHAFVRRYLPGERAADAEMEALAERLGHLPLALKLAGQYLQRVPGLPVSAYVEKLEHLLTHPSMAGWREELGSPTGHDLDLAAAFAVSWERVEDKAVQRLFLLAGHCAPNQPIPQELLRRALQIEPPVGFWKRVARLSKRPPHVTYDEALSTLTGLGLLEMEEDTQAGPMVHPLLAEYAKNQVFGKNLVPEALSALASSLAGLARAANNRMDQTGRPSHFGPLLPHVRLVAESGETEAPEDAAALWANLGYYLRRVADYTAARTAYERALAIGEAVYGPEHPAIAIHVNNLGSVLQDLGDLHGARAAYERALRVLEKFLPPDHPSIRIVRGNLDRMVDGRRGEGGEIDGGQQRGRQRAGETRGER